MGVEQNKPMLTPGVAKVAFSDATARSQLATSWHPAAVAVPCLPAITGFCNLNIFVITLLHSSNNCLKSSLLSVFFISKRSCPEQKLFPLAKIIATLTLLSFFISSRLSFKDSNKDLERALC